VITARATDLIQRVAELTPREWFICGSVTLLVASIAAIGIAGGLLVSSLRDVGQSMRRLHQQQANIVSMLLKAGFRPAGTRNWFDDGDSTRCSSDPDPLTQFDWRKPD
jgi:hypothetical protein